jgi:hypothetical protein
MFKPAAKLAATTNAVMFAGLKSMWLEFYASGAVILLLTARKFVVFIVEPRA